MGEKKPILIALAIIWVFIVIYTIYSLRGPKEEYQKALPGARPERTSVAGDMPRVRLELSGKKAPVYEGVKKDIFSPLAPPPAPPKPATVVEAAEPPPPPPPPTPLELFVREVKFLGFLEKGEKKTVFLGRGADVFVVKSGDVIDTRFRIGEITSTRLTVRDEAASTEAAVELIKEKE
ncbi:MAG: hypothetical protein HY890_07485 [Deltaproteobacteria bacterium]|nr:hypothetical protein [Deltaproteobacteria bacterium]